MIGERIKYIRKQKKLSQKAFAELVQSSSGYISEVEQGKNVPGGNFLISVKRATDANIDWILTGEGEPYLPKTGDRPAEKSGSDDARTAPIDMELLKEIIEVVETVLAKHHLILDPPDKAEAVGILYEMYMDTGKMPEERTTERILRLAA